MKEFNTNIMARNVVESIETYATVSGEVAVLFLREALKNGAREDFMRNLNVCISAAAKHPTHAGALITILLDSILAEKSSLDAETAEHLLAAITNKDSLGRTPLHYAATIIYPKTSLEADIKSKRVACEKLLDVLEQADMAKKGSSIKGLTCQLVKDFYKKSGADFRFYFFRRYGTSTEVSASYKDSCDERQNVEGTRVFETAQAQEIFDCLKSLGAIAAEPKNELLITEDVYERADRTLKHYADGSIMRSALNQESSDGLTVLGCLLDMDNIDRLEGVSLNHGEVGGETVEFINWLVTKGADINATWKHGSGTICEKLADIKFDAAVLLLIVLLRAAKK